MWNVGNHRNKREHLHETPTQKMKFYIKDFFSKCEQMHSFLRVWSHLLKKSLMKTSFFVH